jgi:hypothetical protein
MLAGHIGAGLAIGRIERRVNVGVFIAAALLLDMALWLFILIGWESVSIPADFIHTHQAEFVFPWSHGLPAGLAWSAAAAAAAFFGCAHPGEDRMRAAALIGAAVFSHWLIDALVHVPELPLAGAGSPKVGLGLWQSMPWALALEAAIVVAGLLLFLPGSALPRGQKLWLAGLALLVLVFTILGMTVAPAPPSAIAMAGTSLLTLVVICALAHRFGRLRQAERRDTMAARS